jgi:ATP-binding protein involved in chromosome partitioning
MNSEDVKKAISVIFSNTLVPSSGISVLDSDIASGVILKDGKVGFALNIQGMEQAEAENLQNTLRARIGDIPGVSSVSIVLTAERNSPPSGEHPVIAEGGARKKALWNTNAIPGIQKIIALASGKGGVGKSTVTVLTALALQRQGLRVGIIDADIYGPSIPRMLGIADGTRPEVSGGMMIPLIAGGGIKCMSMGFLTDAGQPLIWRGPMITKTINQFLRGVNWGELDVLLVDMPPGTGDVHLSMIQQVPLSGAIVITTPQQVAVDDALKCAVMFQRLNIPILGIIENMSYLKCAETGGHIKIFGAGGGRNLADKVGSRLLLSIPIIPEVGQRLDSGDSFNLQAIEEIEGIALFRDLSAAVA